MVAPLLIQYLNCFCDVGNSPTAKEKFRDCIKTKATSPKKQTEKRERDKRLAKNWRPISLMNVDTKIAKKVIALRMKTVLPSIRNNDQTAYVKNRYNGESVRVIDDILDHTEKENLDGILLAADMEKAFDSLEHKFIFATSLDLDSATNLFSGLGPF